MKTNNSAQNRIYDSDTGHYDEYQARYDEMKAAFEAGRQSYEDYEAFKEFINRIRISPTELFRESTE